MGRGLLLGALALGLVRHASAILFAFDVTELDFILEMQANFEANNNNKGVADVADGLVQVMSDNAFLFLEGVFRFDLEFGNIDLTDDDTILATVPARIQSELPLLFNLVVLSANTAATDTFSDAIIDLQDNANTVVDLDDIDDQLGLASAIFVVEAGIPHSPSVFCIEENQCVGNRDDQNFGSVPVRDCNNLGAGDGVIATCDTFVANFTLRWLLVWIILSYMVVVGWVVYFGYPFLKKSFSKKKGGERKNPLTTNKYTEQEQTLINTLAAQCASAENLLFQATDMLKQAKHYENIVAVEAKRESRLLILTVEYFQAASAIMVSLTHQYLDRKTFTAGEKYNMEDATVRALQLEVLNYVRDRLQLAFNSDSMTDKSLTRIGEAYAILKKVTDALVLVGFHYDRAVENSLGTLKTPFVDISEDAFFLGGKYNPALQQPGQSNVGSDVSITIEGANQRGLTPATANMYLANSQRDSKIYDPQMQMVAPGTGKALGFTAINAGEVGDGAQNFARTFYGQEISTIFGETQKWVKVDGALEAFLDQERLDREAKAAPVLKRGPQKKRKDKKRRKKGRKKNKNANDEYSYADGYEYETASAVTDYTEASGWSVESGNNYVYNISAVTSQGLNIAGKPGMPYDKPGEKTIKSGNKYWARLEENFPNFAEWPKFYTFVFVVMPFVIMIPMLAKARQGAEAIDLDGNVLFKARAAGFGISFLGVPAYHFLDGFIPEVDDLVGEGDVNFDNTDNDLDIIDEILLETENEDPFNVGVRGNVFISNDQVAQMFEEDFNGASGRLPDVFTADIQAGILTQENVDELTAIRNQQVRMEITTVWLYGLMHTAAYFWGLIPLTLVRESLEILARRFPVIRDVYPMSLWRETHMAMGLAGILFVVFGSTIFLFTQLIAIGKATPFAGLGGDPNIAFFFDLAANVLFIRQFLLPFVPLLFLMKYASRGPPKWMRNYAPSWITLNYWEICYFLHYLTALTAIIVLVIYRPQVFYWMGATWGFIWGGNKIVRILRTRKTTIKQANLVSYTVEDKRNNAKKKSDVLRITLNVPASFPASARGQACWLYCPTVDYIAHPFTLAKVPTDNDKTIMFHIAVRYLPGDDVIAGARPAEPSKKVEAPAKPVNPNELPTGWKATVDPNSGQTYYYNSSEARSTWNKPKVTAADKIFDNIRGVTTRFSANILNMGSARFGGVANLDNNMYGDNSKQFAVSSRATWTQKFAALAYRLQTTDADLRRNTIKNFPVYVSAPLGTSMDDCLRPDLPGSIIITTQNGLPAAESSVRWLLKQDKSRRPKFHYFVSISREVNDALSVVETLRDAMCDSVVAGHLNIEGLCKEAHLCDWLGIYIHLTRRKPSQIAGDREMLLRSLNPPAAQVTERQLQLINDYVLHRVQPGRLPFDRFLGRTQQMVKKRCGMDNMAVGYCGSGAVAASLRTACHRLDKVKFDGEFI